MAKVPPKVLPEVVVPKTGVLAGIYVQAISAYAPHPNAAKLWLEYLYSDEGQEISAKNFYRPINEKIKAKFEKTLPKLPLFTIDQSFGGWDKASKEHFADGAIYDQITQSIKR